MPYTRKNRKGGGFFSSSSSNPYNSKLSNLTARRNSNLAKSKSRVANIMTDPGKVVYTNKKRIEEEYEKAVNELRKIEKPVESAGALRTLANKIHDALNSQEAKESGAVIITIPVGIAQLALKALLLFLSVLVFIFWDIPSMSILPLSAFIKPNNRFNTTRAAYARARRATGANRINGVVQNYV